MLMDELNLKRGILLTDASGEELTQGKKNISVVPISKWLLKL